ncbi:Fic family protein [Longimicrobium sp.]|uniref:Fic family protein n=1 Tax=Longimicrobium sp. TaxID=2029185 RepID=UPI0039C98E47
MQSFVSTRAGRIIQQQAGKDGFSAFIPARLPPVPGLELTGGLRDLLEHASISLGRLDGVSASLDPDRLLYIYVRKEAVLSSQIEGTQSTLSDLLRFEAEGAPGMPLDDVREVSRYVAALHHGFNLLRGGLPVSLRLVRELHRVLMQEGRGSTRAPGDFRRSQNWIGGSRPGNARFVPPPPHEMMIALDNLERFIHDQPERTPPLLKAGLAHAQFETIHPFLDGNGRVGRLLITLLLCAEGALTQPFLYLSLYFREHRAKYYELLQRVRTDGDWESWMEFFLTGVAEVSAQATATTRALLARFEKDRERILIRRGSGSVLTLFEFLRGRVITTIPRAAKELNLTHPTVTTALRRLEDMEIVREITGRPRARVYVYQQQLDILNQGIAGQLLPD